MLSSISVFILVLSILVLVHELGHFVMARRAGVWVEEFGFGLPPRVWGRRIGETTYSINLLPFGGFVRLHGENIEENITTPKKAFLNKNKKTRVGIILAGVIMNFLLAVLAFSIVYTFSGFPRDTSKVRILDVVPGAPADISGTKVGDIVVSVNSEAIHSNKEFIDIVDKFKEKEVEVEVSRLENGKEELYKLALVPRANPPENEGPLGVVISTTEIYYPPIIQRPFVGVIYGFKDALFWGKTVVWGFIGIVGNLFEGEVPKDIAGPVGIFAITQEAYKIGLLSLINFVGILSVNLAILNVIPFPALDGGRLLFIGIESVFGKRVVPKVESVIHSVGMIILLILLVAITASDIRRLITAGGISGFIDTFLK